MWVWCRTVKLLTNIQVIRMPKLDSMTLSSSPVGSSSCNGGCGLSEGGSSENSENRYGLSRYTSGSNLASTFGGLNACHVG